MQTAPLKDYMVLWKVLIYSNNHWANKIVIDVRFASELEFTTCVKIYAYGENYRARTIQKKVYDLRWHDNEIADWWLLLLTRLNDRAVICDSIMHYFHDWFCWQVYVYTCIYIYIYMYYKSRVMQPAKHFNWIRDMAEFTYFSN